ncbi:MAG: UDP-N-acetylmuramoyl-tripeptide--D-alanyl-D-alanine ligase [Candidatus Paceibacterota bacterium]
MKNTLKKIVIAILTWEAKLVLKKYKPKIVAITGTAGKTSTKDAVGSVLEGFVFVRKTEKSYNSDIGVPLTILGLPNKWGSLLGWMSNIFEGLMTVLYTMKYPEWLVLEVGADHPGDIQKLMEWVHPDVAIITAIGDVPVHVEFYAGPDDVFKEKCKLIDGLKKGGILILNHDDERLKKLTVRKDVQVFTYGFSRGSNITASNIEFAEVDGSVTGMMTKIKIDKNVFPLRVHGVVGAQQIYPCLAGISVAKALQKNTLVALQALEKRALVPGRMRILEGIRNMTIIDDSYNASPLAMSAALETLKDMPAKRRIALLGHMAELGVYSEKEHAKVGEMVSDVADLVLTSGSLAEGIADVVRRRKGTGAVVSFSGPENAAQYIATKVKPGDVILVKGSQSARMEKAIKLLLNRPEEAEKLLVRQEDEWRKR